eukprot:12971086-Alexandrium_andersonii.AAC.1
MNSKWTLALRFLSATTAGPMRGCLRGCSGRTNPCTEGCPRPRTAILLPRCERRDRDPGVYQIPGHAPRSRAQ